MFEVIASGGERFRVDSNELRWQYGLVEGSIDIEDKTVVEILKGDDIVKTISQVVAVGDIHSGIELQLPRKPLLRQCTRCGHIPKN